MSLVIIDIFGAKIQIVENPENVAVFGSKN